MNQIAIAQLNQMSRAEFTEALGEIWEETPEIADRAWHNKFFKKTANNYLAQRRKGAKRFLKMS